MQVKHLDHLNLTVENFEESVNWYRRVFGFELAEKGIDNGEIWGVIRSGDALLCIYQKPGFNALTHDEARARKLHTIRHFGLRITDKQAWEETMKRENIQLGFGKYEYPHSTSWYLYDPTGHEIEVACWKEDKIAFPSNE